jgi:hypothetical protein
MSFAHVNVVFDGVEIVVFFDAPLRVFRCGGDILSHVRVPFSVCGLCPELFAQLGVSCPGWGSL